MHKHLGGGKRTKLCPSVWGNPFRPAECSDHPNWPNLQFGQFGNVRRFEARTEGHSFRTLHPLVISRSASVIVAIDRSRAFLLSFHLLSYFLTLISNFFLFMKISFNSLLIEKRIAKKVHCWNRAYFISGSRV